MNPSAPSKSTTPVEGVKLSDVIAGTQRLSAPATTAVQPTSPSLASALPLSQPRVIGITSGQVRPAPTISRPFSHDTVKTSFTGSSVTRPSFVGSNRPLAPAISAVSSPSVTVPFSSCPVKSIEISTTLSNAPHPIMAKPAITTKALTTIGQSVTSVTLGVTVVSNSLNTTFSNTITSSTMATIVPASTSTSAPMASIIRGVTHAQPAHPAHPAMQAAYSSHVPRGAAAVASITTLKSTVATPIPRSSQMYTQGFSSTPTSIAHPSLQPRSSILPTLRAGPPPSISRTISAAFSTSDGHRQLTPTAVSTSLSSTKLLVAAPRAPGETTIRQAIMHSTSSLQKTQPFLQQLHQLPEKGFYRPSYSPATLMPIQSMPVSTSSTPIKAAATSSTTGHLLPTQLVTQTATGVMTTAPVSSSGIPISLSTSTVASSFMTVASSQSQQAYHPHISKVIAQSVHTVAPVSKMQLSGLPTLAIRSAVTTSAVVTNTGSLPRPIVSTGTSIPVAKVYPQPLTVSTRPVGADFAQRVQQHQTSAPTATLFISPPQQRPASGTVAVSAVANLSSPVIAGNVVNTVSTGVIIAETKAERPTVQNTTTFATIPPGTTTYYYEPYHGLPGTAALTMHPFPSTARTHPFAAMTTATLRPAIHATPVRTAVSNTAPVSINSAVIMSMSPNHRQPLAVSSTIQATNVLVSDSFMTSSSVSSTSGTITNLGSLVGHLMPGNVPGSPVHSGVSTTQSVTPSSSPRPSILRKRTIDGANTSVRKNLMSSLPSSQPPSPQREPVAAPSNQTATNTPSSSTSSSPKSTFGGPKEASQENAHSSEGNDSSCNGNISVVHGIVKKEPIDPFDALSGKTALNTVLTVTEASPRKKPRKQQLTGNEMIEVHSTEGEEDFEKANRNVVKKEIVKEDDDGVRWVSTRKRPSVSAMLNAYRHSWKSRNNHFLRYSDIKLKDERRPTISDLANQKGVIQKANGWKVHHICAQIEDMTELESALHSRLSDLLENMEKKSGMKESDDVDLNRANELVRGNLQRCKIIRDQMKDARQQILKVLDHKPRIVDIVTKHVYKSTGRKRDRNNY